MFTLNREGFRIKTVILNSVKLSSALAFEPVGLDILESHRKVVFYRRWNLDFFALSTNTKT